MFVTEFRDHRHESPFHGARNWGKVEAEGRSQGTVFTGFITGVLKVTDSVSLTGTRGE